MHCDILDSFYLKPNGEVPCEDDIGECITLGIVADSSESWSPSRFFQNEKYQKLISAAERNDLPWGDICRKCAHMQPREWKSRLLKRRIRKLQLEPTMLCTLRCPACGNRDQLKLRGGERTMTSSLLERVLRGFREERYRIDYVEWAGQGDPLLHPRISELVELVRSYFPKTLQRVITNGNYDFKKTMKGAFVENIVVSCDGAIQENYEQYRIRGDVRKVFRFMKNAHAYSPKTKIIWKYILFEFNDTDREIILAQRIAKACGVGEMRFVVTATKFRSERFHLANAHELPVRHPRLSVRLNPLVSRIDQMGKPMRQSMPRRFQAFALHAYRLLPTRLLLGSGFDRVFTTEHNHTNHLVVEAWVLFVGSRRRLPVELFLEGQRVARQERPLECQNAIERMLKITGCHLCRFRLSCELKAALPLNVRLLIRSESGVKVQTLVGGMIVFTKSLVSRSPKGKLVGQAS